MRPTVFVGLIVAILGVALLIWQSVVFFTTREAVVQAGPFTVFTPVQHAVWIGPILGGVLVAVGIVLMLVGAARNTN